MPGKCRKKRDCFKGTGKGWKRIPRFFRWFFVGILALQLGLVIPPPSMTPGRGTLPRHPREAAGHLERYDHARESYTTHLQLDHHEHFDVPLWEKGKPFRAGETNLRDGWKPPCACRMGIYVPSPVRRERVPETRDLSRYCVLRPHDRPG